MASDASRPWTGTHSCARLAGVEIYYDPNVQLLVVRRYYLREWDHDDLRASYWRMYWDSEPGACVCYRRQRVPLTPDRIVLVPPNMVIVQRLAGPPVKHLSVHFLADAPFDRLPAKIYAFKAEESMLRVIRALPPDDLDRLRDNLALSLTIRGLIHFLLAQVPSSDLEHRQMPARLAESLAHVEANLRSGLTNQAIAQHMGVSINAMLRQYRVELNASPQEYLRTKRVERACALLHDPARSIKQIADETGFYDRYHFSRVFKAIQGVSPLQYRRQHGL
jgi:AraC-like DNA-binding protein